jgi:hypothetical protein
MSENIHAQRAFKERSSAAFNMARYWLLNELRRVRATVRVGTQTPVNARREQKSLQRDLLNLRTTRV